ncbi:MAG: exosortase/archaeosortase family protein [Planctomycetes bacterium]|nr:exosortase/archaeosortase family protein [Planctomycetota bacterium]
MNEAQADYQGWWRNRVWLSVHLGLVLVAFAVYYWTFLQKQALISLNPDWSHAYLVPVIAGYYVYLNRERLARLRVQRCWWGVPLLLIGMVGYFGFTLTSLNNHTLQGFCMILSLSGVILFLLGRPMWMVLLFPQAYMVLAVRMPEPLLQLVTPKLQQWAAVGSYYLLNIIGYPTDLEGVKLSIIDGGDVYPLNIAEACSGMRMVVGFLALGIAIAFLSCPRWWQRVILVLLAVPVAVLVNIIRVATIGVMTTFDEGWARGDAHIFLGLVWLFPALLLYLGLAWVLQHIVIYEDEGSQQREQKQQQQHSEPVQAPVAEQGGLRLVPSDGEATTDSASEVSA